jgi:uncharacterized phage-associated protein
MAPTIVILSDNDLLTKVLEVLQSVQQHEGVDEMKSGVTCLDVAQYILTKLGPQTTWKLQKLCYYAQAWSFVWDDKPLFSDRIEAWANGPVAPKLYEKHRGEYIISSVREGDSSKLNKTQRETVDAVLKFYGNRDSQWLIALTHRESPWRNARQRASLGPGERGNSVITWDDMAEYYGGLNGEKTA